MRILVACEFSGTVRDALIANGHDAVSCDLLPTESPGPHIQDDVLSHLGDGWDAMIGHPPCTDLAVSGAWRFKEKRLAGKQQSSIRFFMALATADIPRICIENPVSIMSTVWRKPDQIIQPYQFGHDASKRTCLWLKNLPPLRPTKFVQPRVVQSGPYRGMRRWANQTDSGQNRLGPSEDRWKLRSQTYSGVAEAMADQWFPRRPAVALW